MRECLCLGVSQDRTSLSHIHTHTLPYSLTSHHVHRFVLPLLRLIRQCVAGADGIAATMLRSSCPESFLDCDHCQQPQL